MAAAFDTDIGRQAVRDRLLGMEQPMKHGLKIAEIEGHEPKRIGGARKMRPLYNGSCILLMIGRLHVKKWLGLAV